MRFLRHEWPGAARFALATTALAAGISVTGCDETTAPDGSAANPLPLRLYHEVSEDFPSQLNARLGTSGAHLVVRATFAGESRQLQFAALDEFLPTDPPELPLYVHWDGESGESSFFENLEVEVDLSAVIRLHDRRFGAGTPWRIRFVTRGVNQQWNIQFVDVPSPRPTGLIDMPGVIDEEPIEAANLVSWLVGTTRPDSTEVQAVRTELQGIRGDFLGPRHALFSIRYWPPAGMLQVRFTPGTARAVRLGTYAAWSWIGAVYHVASLDAPAERFRIYMTTLLPRCTRVDAFAALPGVVGVTASWDTRRSRLFPLDVGGTRTYLFRSAAGEWPGRDVDHCWYFEPGAAGHRLVGEWDATPGTEPPVWWAAAQRNLDLYARWLADCSRGEP